MVGKLARIKATTFESESRVIIRVRPPNGTVFESYGILSGAVSRCRLPREVSGAREMSRLRRFGTKKHAKEAKWPLFCAVGSATAANRFQEKIDKVRD